MSNLQGVPRRPVLLIVLDGFGINPGRLNNAVAAAVTPNFDAMFARHSHTALHASGPAVGLPDGQMGNSEVGHLTLGCGSIVRQDVVRIDDAVAQGDFFENPALVEAIERCAEKRRPMHLIGLVSDGGVHSSLEHLLALIELCARHGARPLLHMITDGRDTAPRAAPVYVPMIEPALHEAGGAIASIMGRFYAMDRDHRWERTELAWRAYRLGEGQHISESAQAAILSAHEKGETDEFIKPLLLPDFAPIGEGDEAIFFNFRKDRPKQIVSALALPGFDSFERGGLSPALVTCLMSYDKSFDLPYAFAPEQPAITLGKIVSDQGISQFRCAETEKYPHVTFFFNGQQSTPYEGERQHVIPSPKVATYDLDPAMSAEPVASAVISALESEQYGFILVNFANGDMVGHTAVRHAVVDAVEALDQQVGRVLEAAEKADYSVILTADHGNCEEMVDPISKEPHTQHTVYPVPCVIIDEENWQLSCVGGLSNIAPTVLQMMGLDQPAEMTGKSLLLKPLMTPTDGASKKAYRSAA